jgi:hypothetical protein
MLQVVGAVGFANQRLALPPSLDARVAGIINHCWASDAAARPSFAQVCVRHWGLLVWMDWVQQI